MKTADTRQSLSLFRHLPRFLPPGVAGAAVLLSLCAPLSLNAAVVYSGLRNLTAASGSAELPASQSVDLDGGGEAEFTMRSTVATMYYPPSSGPSHLGIGDGMNHYPATWTTMASSTLTLIPSFNPVVSSFTNLAILGQDTLIGPGSRFSSRDSSNLTFWPNETDAYFGFQFNPSGNLTLYGWGRMVITKSAPMTLSSPSGGSADGSMMLVEWGYDDTGASIRAGQVPEPTSAVLAVMGMLAAGFRRRP